MLRLRYLLLAGLLPVIAVNPSLAAEDWNLCRVASFQFIEIPDLKTDETRIQAQTIISEDSQQISFSGDVSVLRARQKLSADEVTMNKLSRQIEASGQVSFEDSNFRLNSSRAVLDDLNDSGSFEFPEFELASQHARGQADQIEKLDNARSRYSNLVYTTCDPQQSDWHMRADQLEIDDNSGRGVAKNTTLYFKEVPFFYFPYFQFPIDDRRMSGMLAPAFGYDEADGTYIRVPLYWNIAPNHDATITSTWYSERGLQLTSENRYLFKQNQGQVDLSYLDDDVSNSGRWLQQWQHSARYAYDIKAELLLAKVSDASFFEDFDSVAPQYNDIRHLQRFASLRRSDNEWHSELLWQNYQTLDLASAVEDRPYQRLPRLTLNGQPDLFDNDFAFQLRSEWVRFERAQSITGTRSHIQPSLSWRASAGWYFFEPELQFAFSDYQLDNNIADNSIYRNIATLSIDSGLIFERYAGNARQWRQTLEPRLYFVFTPYQNQDDIPNFDTASVFKTYDNLFTNNRFSGFDRIGDANQVTLGLANHLFRSDGGDELLQARLGQTYYFEDRRVSLDASTDDQPRSDSIAEVDIWPNRDLKIGGRLVYSPQQNELSDRVLSINYSKQGFAANLEYYFIDKELEQALISLVYPINERWTMVAKAQHSLLFDKPVENLIGIAYESCCWGLKILAGQSGDELENFAKTDNGIFFELTLKGLSQAGQDIDSKLRNSIPGYSPVF